ncbi:hypothetical protein ACKX2L_06120 [Lachnospiraceae bacterium YH-ros2228]
MKRTNIPEERIDNIRAELHRVEKVYKDGLSFDLSVGKKPTLLMNGTVIRRYQDPSQIVQDAILLSIGYHTALTQERLENRNSRDRLAKQLHDGQTEIKETGVKETPSITEKEKEEVMQEEEDMDLTETLESESEDKEEEEDILSHPECRVHAVREESIR